MHSSSMIKMKKFYDTYVFPVLDKGVNITVVDVGGMDINGSYRQIFTHPRLRYIATDIGNGPGVDHIQINNYELQFPDESVDIVISGQTFEHTSKFWDLAAEMGRILKPGGKLALICPSSGPIHRHPVDCYRFLPDSMAVIAEHAGLELIEVEHDGTPPWNDVSGIMTKPVRDVNILTQANKTINYIDFLKFLHYIICPKIYFELGINLGETLALARCASVAVDPRASSLFDVLKHKTTLKFFAMTDDEFFSKVNLNTENSGFPVDFGFINGVSSFEHALRVINNLEQYCSSDTILCLRCGLDCSYTGSKLTKNEFKTNNKFSFYDVIHQCRPKLRLEYLDVEPDGLIIISGFLQQVKTKRLNKDLGSIKLNEAWFSKIKHGKICATSIESFFAKKARVFFAKSLRCQKNQTLIRNASLDFFNTLNNIEILQWNDDETARLMHQIKCYPTYVKTWTLLLKHLHRINKLCEATSIILNYKHIFVGQQTGKNLLMVLVDTCHNLNDLKTSAEILRVASSFDPGNPEYLMRLSHIYIRLNNLNDAVELVRSAIALDNSKANFHHHLGALLLRVNDFDAAASSLKYALKLDENIPDCHIKLSNIYARQNDLERAICFAKSAVALDNNANYHHFLGILLLKINDLVAASRSLEYALKLNKNIPDCHIKLSNIYLRLNDLEKAVCFAESAVELNKNKADYHHHLGVILLKTGNLDAATDALENALKLDKNISDCHIKLSHIYAKNNNLIKAIESARSAVLINNLNAGYHYQLGTLLLRLGKLDEAASALEMALKLNINNLDCQNKINYIYERRNNNY